MIKYVPELTSVVFEEIPDKVSLAVEISNCLGVCEGCHSPFLRKDIGQQLTEECVKSLIDNNFGVDCFLFLGEGNDPAALLSLARYIKRNFSISLALYSGREEVEQELWSLFDYIKTGAYIPHLGPLSSPTTNQRLYRISAGERVDITEKFWLCRKC